MFTDTCKTSYSPYKPAHEACTRALSLLRQYYFVCTILNLLNSPKREVASIWSCRFHVLSLLSLSCPKRVTISVRLSVRDNSPRITSVKWFCMSGRNRYCHIWARIGKFALSVLHLRNRIKIGYNTMVKSVIEGHKYGCLYHVIISTINDSLRFPNYSIIHFKKIYKVFYVLICLFRF